MRFKVMMAACALALLASVTAVNADRNRGGDVQLMNEMPKPAGLKVEAGQDEGHKSPIEVVTKAIKAAKEGDTDALLTCIPKEQHDQAKQRDWSAGQEEVTNLASLTAILARFDTDHLREMKQGSVGNYAVVSVRHGEALHMIRTSRTKIGDSDERNWMLSHASPQYYRIDYNAPDVRSIREAVMGDDVKKLVEFLDEYQCRGLEMLKGVDPEVDPYALLQQRLKSNMESAERPIWLLNTYTNSVALWFHSDKGDKFVVLAFREDRDWRTSEVRTKVVIDIDATSTFHTGAFNAYRNWVADWNW